MKNFKFGNGSRDGRDSSRGNFDGGDSSKPLLYDVVCDECGKDCKVPFKPSGGRPVYCSDCFEKKGGRDSNGSRDGRDSSRGNFDGGDSSKPLLYDVVCDECGKDCKVPFKPSGGRPVYCSDCFEKKGGRDSDRSRDRRDSSRRNFGGRDSRKPSQNNTSDRSISQLTGKIGVLNTKLDTIISLLSSAGDKKPKSIENKTKKSKKSTTKRADKVTKVLTPVKKKDIKEKKLKQK